MKHVRPLIAATAVAAALVLAACSSSSTDKLISGLTNFNRGLSAVDSTVQQINATLYSNCQTMVTVAGAINDLSGNCSKAAPYTSVANSVIDNYCQAAGVQNAGIAASVAITASSVKTAKDTLAANKKACGAS